MLTDFSVLKSPELVVGIAGPIGVDMEGIYDALEEAFRAVGYKAIPVRITDEIKDFPSSINKPVDDDYYSLMTYKMQHASAICRQYDDEAVLIRFAIDAIRRERGKIAEEKGCVPTPFEDVVESKDSADSYDEESSNPAEFDPIVDEVAYIVRQIKRPQEVEILRRVYGKQFIFLSAYGSSSDRKSVIEQKLKRSMPVDAEPVSISARADDLMFRDQNEEGDPYGQHLRDAFHLADVFVDGINKAKTVESVSRFVNAFFGLNEIAPTKAEYGMYAAKSASLRSSDLSRQVGAAIFTPDGELISQGCNEVPKAGGGTYWDTEDPDYRDIKLGHDPNEILKLEVVRDLLERLKNAELLSDKVDEIGGSSKIVDVLTNQRGDDSDPDYVGCLYGSQVLELTEYGRVVHAEMCAICDAARLGRPVLGGIVYCTTFPCHNCTKHIVAAGIRRVVYMEPYPRSRAKELHEHEIEIEIDSEQKVSFMPFIGIAPHRYRDIFEKRNKRKSGGIAKKWYYDDPSPPINVLAPIYTQLEKYAIAGLVGDMEEASNGNEEPTGS